MVTSPFDNKNATNEMQLTYIPFSELDFLNKLCKTSHATISEGTWKSKSVAIKDFTVNACYYTDGGWKVISKKEFLSEAKITMKAGLRTNYVVQLKGVALEESPPRYALVMEYMRGGDLFNFLHNGGELTWPKRYQLGIDITLGVYHLHKCGIIYRDLKSMNVLLDGNGRAKLADFGLSILATSLKATTVGKIFMGTRFWAAPELKKPGEKLTTAADIYSLSTVLWELASGKKPLPKNISLDGIPEAWANLIVAGRAEDPKQRPTAKEIAKNLIATRYEIVSEPELQKIFKHEKTPALIVMNYLNPYSFVSEHSQNQSKKSLQLPPDLPQGLNRQQG